VACGSSVSTLQAVTAPTASATAANVVAFLRIVLLPLSSQSR
jgi:hypothetical protein